MSAGTGKSKAAGGLRLTPEETADQLAEELNAEFVQAIGAKFVLYRESKAKKKEGKQIVLPEELSETLLREHGTEFFADNRI